MQTLLAKRVSVAFLALILYCMPEASGADARGVRLAFAGFGIGTVLTWIASEENLFESYGLQVEHVYLESPNAGGVQALLGVDFFMGSGDVLAPFAAISGGADVVFVAAHTTKENYQFGVASNIADIPQLKGKKVGVSGLGRKSDLIARVVLRRAGLDPVKDVEFVSVGFSPERAAALYRNRVQGAPLVRSVAAEAQRIGLRILDIGEVQLITDLLMTTRTRVEQDPGVAVRLLKGYLAAIQFFLTNPEKSMSIMAQHVALADGATLPGLYRTYAAQLSTVPLPDDEAIQALIDAASVADARARELAKEQILEPRFLKELMKSGFVKSLYSEKVSL